MARLGRSQPFPPHLSRAPAPAAGSGTSAIPATGILDASGAKGGKGTGAVPGTGTLTASGVRAAHGPSSLASAGTLKASGVKAVTGSSSITGTGLAAAQRRQGRGGRPRGPRVPGRWPDAGV